MKKFFLKLFIFFCFAIVVDFAFGKSMASLQKTGKGGTTYRDNYIMNECKEEILIMGSSRASHHYISKIMSDSLKTSVYNAGRDGNGIILNYGFLLEILKRYKPNTIIYELTPRFDWIQGDNDRYLPHLRNVYNSPEIKDLFNDVNPTEKYKMLSK